MGLIEGVGWLCSSGASSPSAGNSSHPPHFCLTGSQPVPRDTSDPDDPCPPRCQQLPPHRPRCPAHCSVSGSLCNTPAPTRACLENAHRSSGSLCLHCSPGRQGLPTGEEGLGLSRARGPQSGTTWTQVCRAQARSAGDGPSHSGQQVAEGTGSGRRPGSDHWPPPGVGPPCCPVRQ